MARVPLIDVADMTPTQRAQFARFPSNLTRAILLLDERLARQLPATANALRAADLDPAWREAITLRVAALQRSTYERFQHLDQARAQGWSAKDIAGVEGGVFSGLPDGLRKVLTLVDAVVAGPEVDDDTVTAARTVLSDQQLATVIVLVGHYMTVARYTRILGVELDDAPDDWTTEH